MGLLLALVLLTDQLDNKTNARIIRIGALAAGTHPIPRPIPYIPYHIIYHIMYRISYKVYSKTPCHIISQQVQTLLYPYAP